MADLIELDIVVRDKTLKQSVSTVDRLERQITKANKAINEGTMSQSKYNKILLAAKREYQALGMSSQKATGQVRAFAAANKKSQIETHASTAAIHNNTAALHSNSKALGNTKNKMNGSNIAVQQLGYQVSDFTVQVQGGTSAFTAFSQQASQLVGILPALTMKLGMTLGASIALSSALGILIPLVSVAGRMLYEMGGSAASAAKDIEELQGALDDLASATDDVAESMKFSLEGTFTGARDELNGLLETFKEMKAEVAREALATGVKPLVNNIADMMDDLSDKKSSRQDTLDRNSRRPGFMQMGDDEKSKIVAEMQAIAEMQVEAGKFLTGIQTAIQGPSEEFSENMLKVSQAITNSDTATQSMKDQLHLLLTESGMLAELQKEMADQHEEALEKQKAGLEMIAKAKALDAKLLADDRKKRDAIAAEDRAENVKTLAAMEIALFKENAAYVKSERELDAAGDLAILENQVAREKELMAENASYEREQAAIRQRETEELTQQMEQMAERLAIPFERVIALIQQAKAEAQVSMDAFGGDGAFKYGGNSKFNGEAEYDRREADAKRAAAADARAAAAAQRKSDSAAKSAANEAKALKKQAEAMNRNADATAKYKYEYEKLEKLRGNGLTEKAFAKEVEKLNEQLANSDPVLKTFTDSFKEFLNTGATDFKKFSDSILDMLKNMLTDMIVMTTRNKIMISMGLGGDTFKKAAGSGHVTGVGSQAAGGKFGKHLGGFGGGGKAGTGLLGGFGAAGKGAMAGFSKGGLAGGIGGFFNVGGNAAAAGGGVMATIGAAAAPLLAIGAAISFFSSKTKELDSGLKATITNVDATVSSFKRMQKSRFWGLSKKKYGVETQMSEDDAAPLINSIRAIQTSVREAADSFGMAGHIFDNFSYEFKLSLKGLSDEVKAEKVAEELVKMGDSFASLTGHFKTLNELMEAASERMAIQTRLDELLGNSQAMIARQRKEEIAGLHELNKPLAQLVYNLEDAQDAVANAFDGLARAIEAERDSITASFDGLLDGLKTRLEAANEVMKRSESIVNLLEGALRGRSVTQGVQQAFSRREGALNFIKGGNFEDEEMLKDALSVVSEPTEGLYGTFVDYAREFGQTSAVLRDSKEVAEIQLSAAEQAVLVLEQQIETANTNHDATLAKLDERYAQAEREYNALLGIDDSVKSVEGALGDLSTAMREMAAAQAAAKSAAAAASKGFGGGAGNGNASSGVRAASSGGQAVLDKLGQSGVANRASDGAMFKRILIKNSQQLLSVAGDLGVKTAGKTGAQIQQLISNAANLGVGMDTNTRALQFATGGSFGGGLRMVGERGPELEATGASRIFSNKDTAKMFKNPELVEEIKSLRSEVAGLRSDTRQMQASNSKYVKRNYEINRKWDVEGLPEQRT